MKNKIGKGNAKWVFGTIGIILIVGLLGYMAFSQDISQPPTLIGGQVDCETEPYIENATFNEYSRGTGVGVVMSYVLDGSKDSARTLTPGSSGTTFNVGDSGKIISVLSGYIDRVDDFTITKCGGNKFTNYISQGDAITLEILDSSLVKVTDGVVATNALNLTDGGAETSASFIVRIKGARDKSTGQVLITLEANATEMDTMSIIAKSSGAKVIESNSGVYDGLDLFSAEGTAPTDKFAFIVDSVEDGDEDDYLISVTSESGEILGASDATGVLYVNAYAGQWFINPDGELEFGWEDEDGTAKYEQKSSDHEALFS